MSLRIIRLLVLWSGSLVVPFTSSHAQEPEKQPDQATADRYHNPILPGDFQNTDVIRVGTTYYYISATKELSPGMLIMASKDLVNWKPIGHAVNDLTQIHPRYNYDRMEGNSRGIWAGSIRHHNNRFYVYFTDPDYGLFVTTATRPEGPWSALTPVKKEAGWDDPCPFWDDNGQAYLVMTHFADAYKIRLFRMSSDGKALLDTGTVLYQGKGSEASKLYKINGYYYHFYSEVTPEGRIPFMARARTIQGPYTERRQLIHKAEGEPNQGGLVQTTGGSWYFVTHHGNAYWCGREASLLPVVWQDGWPLWGKPGTDGIGNMVWSAEKPRQTGPIDTVQTSDDFTSATLSPQWEWYFQPRTDKWSLTENPGFLRLYACKPLQPDQITKTTNVLTQRPLRTDKNVATVKMAIAQMVDGQAAGLALFGKTTGRIHVRRSDTGVRFICDQPATSTASETIDARTRYVWFRASWNKAGEAQFSYSTDGQHFENLGPIYQLTNFGNYLGAKLGLYTVNDTADRGFVDIDWFHYHAKRP